MNLSIAALENMKLKELYELAKEFKISYYSKLTKKELIFAILKARAEKEGFFFMEGVLEIIQSEGFGFLRPINYSPSSEDIYISLRKFVVSIYVMEIKFLVKYDLRKKMNATLDYYKLKL